MTSNNYWNDEWSNLQKQYWQQLGEFSRKAMGTPEQTQNNWMGYDWNNAMSQWWQNISSAMPNQNKGFMEKILEQGNAFYHMNEGLFNNLDKTNDWSEMLSNVFEKMQSGFANQAEQASGQIEESFSKVMGFWQSPMENWRQLGNSIDINNHFLKNSNLLEKMLDMPGLGYTREDEEQYKQLFQAGLHYQHSMMEYNRIFANMGTLSISRMKDKVKKYTENDKQIESGRELYNLWVSACEEVYSELTITPEYARVHGELINSQMSVKKKWEEMIDQKLGTFNMPTRREVCTLQTRLQESRREVRAVKSELNCLKDEFEKLKSDMQAVARQSTSSDSTSAKTAPANTTAVKKKRTITQKATPKNTSAPKAATKTTAKKD
ncbi:MAG: class III poly(R)-hydroxyalkanoic acid synthase subunit PhaE [Gammaproteobacteria bacterium]|nr:class III poly(R)-hydroxyalkanoic acid synthase subunit PhaE [Gammaproteobacteria bacterium]